MTLRGTAVWALGSQPGPQIGVQLQIVLGVVLDVGPVLTSEAHQAAHAGSVLKQE